DCCQGWLDLLLSLCFVARRDFWNAHSLPARVRASLWFSRLSPLLNERVWSEFLVLNMSHREHADQMKRLAARVDERMRNSCRDFNHIGPSTVNCDRRENKWLFLPATRALL